MDVLAAQSRGKINLTLHIRGRRADGYHELESIVAQIELADDVTVEAWAGPAITVDCSDASLPTDAKNLAVRAALLLRSWAAVGRGAHIRLDKRIPAGAGLGGGSSNAATTLRLLDRLWHLSVERDELREIGAMLGSDVPLFLIDAPLNIMRGRGELLEAVPERLEADVLLALPPIHSQTSAVYAAFSRLGRIAERPAAGEVLRHSQDREGSPGQVNPEELMPRLFNDLEPAAAAVTPALGDFAARLRGESGLAFCMSGSGAAYFYLFRRNSGAAEMHRARLETQFPGVRFVSTALAGLSA